MKFFTALLCVIIAVMAWNLHELPDDAWIKLSIFVPSALYGALVAWDLCTLPK